MAAALVENDQGRTIETADFFGKVGQQNFVGTFLDVAESFLFNAVAIVLAVGVVFPPQQFVAGAADNVEHVFGVSFAFRLEFFARVRGKDAGQGNGGGGAAGIKIVKVDQFVRIFCERFVGRPFVSRKGKTGVAGGFADNDHDQGGLASLFLRQHAGAFGNCLQFYSPVFGLYFDDRDDGADVIDGDQRVFQMFVFFKRVGVVQQAAADNAAGNEGKNQTLRQLALDVGFQRFERDVGFIDQIRRDNSEQYKI